MLLKRSGATPMLKKILVAATVALGVAALPFAADAKSMKSMKGKSHHHAHHAKHMKKM